MNWLDIDQVQMMAAKFCPRRSQKIHWNFVAPPMVGLPFPYYRHLGNQESGKIVAMRGSTIVPRKNRLNTLTIDSSPYKLLGLLTTDYWLITNEMDRKPATFWWHEPPTWNVMWYLDPILSFEGFHVSWSSPREDPLSSIHAIQRISISNEVIQIHWQLIKIGNWWLCMKHFKHFTS